MLVQSAYKHYLEAARKNETFNSNFFGRLILQFRRGFRREPLINGIIPFNGINPLTFEIQQHFV